MILREKWKESHAAHLEILNSGMVHTENTAYGQSGRHLSLLKTQEHDIL
jgi:hypothetical protein